MTTDTHIDWPQMLADMAFLLGEEDHTQPGGRQHCSQKVLGEYIGRSRTTVQGWLDGQEPKHFEGEMIIRAWCGLTTKAREFAPRQRPVFSASRMKEKA